MSSIEQIRAGRGLLGWSQADLAKAAGLSEPTVKRFETGQTNVSEAAIAKMVAALAEAGVFLTNGHEPGVKMRRPTAEEREASEKELRRLVKRIEGGES